MPQLAPGTILHVRYRVIRPVGKGGMGAVYEAVDFRLHNIVAVKQMTAGGFDADRAFEQEARLLAALRHPALPVVIDYFIEANGRFLVMQYIDGEDLAQVLRQGVCSPDDVLEWALAVLDVLEYLHRQSPPVVHRDIKPANLKRTPRGEILLLDFGLAKGAPDSQTRLADEDRSIFGFTPRYAPPEQVEWRGTDPRSDLYALGATLYHLVTGVSPPSAPERVAAIADGYPDPLVACHTINRRASQPFSAAVARALELDPAARWPSARDMRAALLEEGSQRRPPRPTTKAAGARRVDAAMPSQAEVGRQIDLIVQVRFADSPLLGLEDWPTRRPPAQIEQGSEPLQLEYPMDPRTGAQMPARLRVKVVAPDFVVEGAAEHLIDVPPDEYSKRLAFLIAPRRAGYCRLNVEVYGPDAVYLGVIPVEAEAVAVSVPHPVLRVANIVLGLFTHERVPLPETESREFLPAPPSVVAKLPSIPASAGRRLRRWAAVVAPMVVVMATAVILFQRFGPMSTDISLDVSPPAAPSSPPGPVPEPVPSGPPPPPPTTVPRPVDSVIPQVPPPSAPVVSPPPATRPAPAVPPSPPPLAGGGLGRRIPATADPNTGLGWRVASSSHPRVELHLPAVERLPGRLRLNLEFVNRSGTPVPIALDYHRTVISGGQGTIYAVVADGARTGRTGTFTTSLRAFTGIPVWIEFDVPDETEGTFELTVVTRADDNVAVRFPGLKFSLPKQ